MARSKSDEKREAILIAAVRIVAAQGLAAPTAVIAKEAGVSNGTLFTYFATKAELLNQLYIRLKSEMAKATTADVPVEANMREQVLHVWNAWLRWALAHSKERRALAHLAVSHEVTAASRQAASEAYVDVAALLDRTRAAGPMADAPLMFVATLVTGIVDATIDYMTSDPGNAETHAATGFQALWRILA